ncbi:hypothetical protein F5X96DRAFT_646180 [Biscogniauxia mediterranea]|nr:hypothetical protein F5X96DRAFT_646180 [Biscogniauxia mediterranea]
MFEGFVKQFSEENWSWISIPLAILIALYGRLWAGFIGPGSRFYNPLLPRQLSSDVEVDGIPPVLRGRIQRAEASMSNAFESLGLFAAAVVAANVEGVELWTLNVLCYSYLASRVFYTWVYIYGQELQLLPVLTRTAVWLAGIALILGLFLTPGVKVDALEENPSYWFSTAIKVQENPARDILRQ